MANVLALDIEATNLSANFGYILCIGYKRVGSGPVRIISIADSPDYEKKRTSDKWVVQQIRSVIENADAITTHYGKRFDIPYINTRLLRHGLPVVPPRLNHIDTWEIAKKKMKLNSNRLVSLASHLQTADDKTAVLGQHWVDAGAGDKKALKYIIDHCKKDVLVLEESYLKLRPLMTNHPSMAVVDGVTGDACPVCASPKLQKRGFHVTPTGRRQRFHCQNCGAWSHGNSKRLKGCGGLT